MKLVITSQGPGPTDPMDSRFGRAQYHLLFDTDAGEYTTLDNASHVEAAQGAGIQAAQNVVAQGAKVLITGHCGPNAFHALSAAGVQIYRGTQATVAEAVEAWRNGSLEPITAPMAPGRH